MTLRLFGLDGVTRAQAVCDGCGTTVRASALHPNPRNYVPRAWAWLSPVGRGHALCAEAHARSNPTRAPCERHHSIYLCDRCEGGLAPVTDLQQQRLE